MEDLQSSQHLNKCERWVDEPEVETCNKSVQCTINQLAPSCSKIIALRPETPWSSDKFRSAKKTQRKVERSWHQTSSMVHFDIYIYIYIYIYRIERSL